MGLVFCSENTNMILVEEICIYNKSVGLPRGEFVYSVYEYEDHEYFEIMVSIPPYISITDTPHKL